MKILSFGEAVIDVVYLVKDLKLDRKNEILLKKISFGGPSLVASLFLSFYGFKPYFFTSLGRDKEGVRCKKFLERCGIKIIKLGNKTKKNLVILNNGIRTIFRESESEIDFSKLKISFLKNANLIILDRHFSSVFKFLKNSKAEIIFDPSTEISQRTLEVLKNINYPIIPIESLKNFHKESLYKALKKAKKLIGDLIIVTCGRFGSFILEKNKILFFRSYKSKAIDPTGAGDVFRSAFAYGVLKNWPLYKTIDFANFVSALHTEKLGNGDSLPKPKEIKTNKREKNNFKFKDVVEFYKKIE